MDVNPEMSRRQGMLLWLLLTVLLSTVHLWYYHWHFELFQRIPHDSSLTKSILYEWGSQRMDYSYIHQQKDMVVWGDFLPTIDLFIFQCVLLSGIFGFQVDKSNKNQLWGWVASIALPILLWFVGGVVLRGSMLSFLCSAGSFG